MLPSGDQHGSFPQLIDGAIRWASVPSLSITHSSKWPFGVGLKRMVLPSGDILGERMEMSSILSCLKSPPPASVTHSVFLPLIDLRKYISEPSGDQVCPSS